MSSRFGHFHGISNFRQKNDGKSWRKGWARINKNMRDGLTEDMSTTVRQDFKSFLGIFGAKWEICWPFWWCISSLFSSGFVRCCGSGRDELFVENRVEPTPTVGCMWPSQVSKNCHFLVFILTFLASDPCLFFDEFSPWFSDRDDIRDCAQYAKRIELNV
jgi:hypothetical protein